MLVAIQKGTFEYSAVKKGTFLTSHSKMLAIIQKGKVPFWITHNTNYIKRPIYGTYSCSTNCTFAIYNRSEFEDYKNKNWF